MRYLTLLLLLVVTTSSYSKEPTFEQTPYAEPRVMFEFYFDTPEKNKFGSLLDSFVYQSLIE